MTIENPIPAPALEPLSPTDERTWAMLAHLSVLLNLVTGFLGPVAAFLIYLIYKDRSRFVAYHALQSAIFQSIWWLAGGLLGGLLIGLIWTVTGLLSAVLIGLLCVPLAILLTVLLVAAPVYALIDGVIAAVQVNQGRDFRYWLVGDLVRSTLTG